MIDLDELLCGTPTWEEVIEFWSDDGDFCEENILLMRLNDGYKRKNRERLCLITVFPLKRF